MAHAALKTLPITNRSMSVHSEVKRVTTHTLQEMKLRKEKISCLTAYDFSLAQIVDAAGKVQYAQAGNNAKQLSITINKLD